MKLPKIRIQFDPTFRDIAERYTCARCKRTFPDNVLKSPPLFLQIIAFPIYLKSLQTAKEAGAKYCPPCRRSINASLFFVGFVTLLVVGFLIKKVIVG